MSSSMFPNLQAFFASYGMLLLIVPLIPGIIIGIMTAKLAAKKGYRGYFFTGFFFQVIGLIYVVGLPLAEDCAVYAKKRMKY